MLSKVAKNIIEFVENNPRKSKSIVDGLVKTWESRDIIIKNKNTIISGLQSVEKSLITVKNLVDFSLDFNFLKKGE